MSGRRLRWLNRLGHAKNRLRFMLNDAPSGVNQDARKVVLLIGPESTATRAFTEAFSSHTRILGTENARGHHDVLDPVWIEVEKGRKDRAIEAFPETEAYDLVLTRRSIPHSTEPGLPAQYMSTPNLDLFREVCAAKGLSLFVLVTSRSPIPNLVSWANERASTGGSLERAYRQYLNAFKTIFRFIEKNDLPFFIVSLESFVLEGERLIKGLHCFLGLRAEGVNVKAAVNPNIKRYNDYWNQGVKK